MLLLDHHQLQQRPCSGRNNFHGNLSLGLHRALSLLNRSESLHIDLDIQFIFLWIAFGAAYGK
jgi:hypothetical protein